jgi:hypothetical protein
MLHVMNGQAKPSIRNEKERQKCQRKYRHADFLSALHHARRIDDGSLGIYGCEYCGGSHVGHHQTPTLSTKLQRNSARLERARRALRSNNGSMKPEKRLAFEQSVRDLLKQRSELEAEMRTAGAQNPAFLPESDPWSLVATILIGVGMRLQHLGCEFAARSRQPWGSRLYGSHHNGCG